MPGDANAPPRTPDTVESVLHIPALDGLRGLAILLVLPWHLLRPSVLEGSWLLAPLKLVRNMGWSGVDLFFVLSGFLITSILIENKGSKRYFSTFYARRLLRIVPLYYTLLAVCVFILPQIPYLAKYSYFWGDQGSSIWYWAFLSNFRYLLPIPEHQFLGVTWSLSIEEQYYVLWPLVVWLFRWRVLVGIEVALIIGSAALRFYLVDFTDLSTKFPYFFTPSHLDGLAAGGLIALLRFRGSSGRRFLDAGARALPLLAVAAGAVAAYAVFLGTSRFPTYDPVMLKYGYLLNALFFASLLLHCVVRQGWVSRLFALAPLRSFGKYSYAIYLLHWPAAYMVEEAIGLSGMSPGQGKVWEVTLFLLTCGTAYAMGWLSWRVLEGPINNQKRHFRF